MDAIGVMVELGAKVSAVMEHCTLETPLHIAARCGRRDVLRKLLRCGLPVLARTKVCSSLVIIVSNASYVFSWHMWPGPLKCDQVHAFCDSKPVCKSS